MTNSNEAVITDPLPFLTCGIHIFSTAGKITKLSGLAYFKKAVSFVKLAT
jgi:hypothetical protein